MKLTATSQVLGYPNRPIFERRISRLINSHALLRCHQRSDSGAVVTGAQHKLCLTDPVPAWSLSIVSPGLPEPDLTALSEAALAVACARSIDTLDEGRWVADDTIGYARTGDGARGISGCRIHPCQHQQSTSRNTGCATLPTRQYRVRAHGVPRRHARRLIFESRRSRRCWKSQLESPETRWPARFCHCYARASTCSTRPWHQRSSAFATQRLNDYPTTRLPDYLTTRLTRLWR